MLAKRIRQTAALTRSVLDNLYRIVSLKTMSFSSSATKLCNQSKVDTTVATEQATLGTEKLPLAIAGFASSATSRARPSTDTYDENLLGSQAFFSQTIATEHAPAKNEDDATSISSRSSTNATALLDECFNTSLWDNVRVRNVSFFCTCMHPYVHTYVRTYKFECEHSDTTSSSNRPVQINLSSLLGLNQALQPQPGSQQHGEPPPTEKRTKKKRKTKKPTQPRIEIMSFSCILKRNRHFLT